MPTPPLDEPAVKITLRIWEDDYNDLKRIYGQGWSVKVREIIRKHLREPKNVK